MTEKVRVDTHSASTSGSLVTQDVSDTFVPRKGRKNLMIESRQDVVLDPAFQETFKSRRSRFYSANRRDTHHETSWSLHLPAIVAHKHFQWVSSGCCALPSEQIES